MNRVESRCDPSHKWQQCPRTCNPIRQPDEGSRATACRRSDRTFETCPCHQNRGWQSLCFETVASSLLSIWYNVVWISEKLARARASYTLIMRHFVCIHRCGGGKWRKVEAGSGGEEASGCVTTVFYRTAAPFFVVERESFLPRFPRKQVSHEACGSALLLPIT